jgi:hypothetical protein
MAKKSLVHEYRDVNVWAKSLLSQHRRNGKPIFVGHSVLGSSIRDLLFFLLATQETGTVVLHGLLAYRRIRFNLSSRRNTE